MRGHAAIIYVCLTFLVTSRRGKGRIRNGYFSGEILQYEVEGAGGRLYMAGEDELRRR